MRKALRWLLSLVVLIGTLSAAGATAGAATAAEPTTGTDIKDRILGDPGHEPDRGEAVPGLPLLRPRTTPSRSTTGTRGKGTFKQRITLLHKDTARPTVFFTSRLQRLHQPRAAASRRRSSTATRSPWSTASSRPSRPDPADWSKLDIWQAASDQHRIFKALKKIYAKKWLSTGGSKGGMTATYYERFYPRDMDGVVAYVAPNDVVNKEDSAYDRFFAKVGTKECRDRLNAVQREALVRREPLEAKYAEFAAAEGAAPSPRSAAWTRRTRPSSSTTCGASGSTACSPTARRIPDDAKTATDQEIWDIDRRDLRLLLLHRPGPGAVHAVLLPGRHRSSARPTSSSPHLEGLSRYGYQPPRNFVPARHPDALPAVRDAGRRHLGAQQRPPDAVRLRRRTTRGAPSRSASARAPATATSITAPGANHGANVAGLVDGRRRPWPPPGSCSGRASPRPPSQDDPAKAKPLATYDAKLDKRDVEREPTLRP